jgi:Holliday junction resolvase-like predicted endonuclease
VGKGKRLLLCANGSDHMLVLAATDTQLAKIRDTISEYLAKQPQEVPAGA